MCRVLIYYHIWPCSHYCLVPGRVEDLEVVAVNDHTIHVSWNPPLTPNGVLTSYEVVVENLVNATETYNHRVYPRERQINISSGFRKFKT